MSPRWKRAIVGIAILTATSLWLLERENGPGTPEGAATIGVETDRPSPERGTITSPSGEEISFGQVDRRGYTLPLDVAERPKPRRTEGIGPIPEWRASEPARGGAPFEEHRLGPDEGHTENETSLDVSGSTLVAGWNQYDDSGLLMGVGRSTDGGHTWVHTAFTDHTVTSDPVVRAGGGDVWYYAYLASGGPTGGSDIDIFVRRSLDDGATWELPVDASQNGSFDDKPYIDADGDEVLVGWADFAFSPAKVRVSRSLDGGVTFGANTILANSSVGGNGACPVIGPGGEYYMFWRDSFQDSLWISRSLNQGATWSPDRGIVPMDPLPTPLPGGFRMVNLPTADADPITGDLLVLWNDQALGDPDVLAIRSADGGETWSAPVRVNDDAGGATQFFPWVTFDEAGVAHAVWYDRRENGFDIDVYTARSLDGGATWSANVRVTASAFTPVLPGDTSLDFIGDYNGITASAGMAYPFYQDGRRGEQDVYVSLVPYSTVAAPEPGAVTPAVTLRAAPSPFEASTRIVRDGAGARAESSGEESLLQIFDAGGRLVRSLDPIAPDEWEWDGRSGTGTAVPPGVYHARARGAGESVRLVKLR